MCTYYFQKNNKALFKSWKFLVKLNLLSFLSSFTWCLTRRPSIWILAEMLVPFYRHWAETMGDGDKREGW